MKDFDCFRNETKDAREIAYAEINKKIQSYVIEHGNSRSLDDVTGALSDILLKSTLDIVLEELRLYHEWITQQLK